MVTLSGTDAPEVVTHGKHPSTDAGDGPGTRWPPAPLRCCARTTDGHRHRGCGLQLAGPRARFSTALMQRITPPRTRPHVHTTPATQDEDTTLARNPTVRRRRSPQVFDTRPATSPIRAGDPGTFGRVMAAEEPRRDRRQYRRVGQALGRTELVRAHAFTPQRSHSAQTLTDTTHRCRRQSEAADGSRVAGRLHAGRSGLRWHPNRLPVGTGAFHASSSVLSRARTATSSGARARPPHHRHC